MSEVKTKKVNRWAYVIERLDRPDGRRFVFVDKADGALRVGKVIPAYSPNKYRIYQVRIVAITEAESLKEIKAAFKALDDLRKM